MESTLKGPSFVSYCDFLTQESTLVTPYSAPSPFSGLQSAIAVLTLVHHLRLPGSPLICLADPGRRTPRSTYLASKPCLFEQHPPRTDLRRCFCSPCPGFATPDVDQAQLAPRALFHEEDRIDRPSLSRLADSRGYDMILPRCPKADPRAPPLPSSAIYAALRLAVYVVPHSLFLQWMSSSPSSPCAPSTCRPRRQPLPPALDAEAVPQGLQWRRRRRRARAPPRTIYDPRCGDWAYP
ncbi:hypothetical protein C8R45DRAFT_415500 [Mycena sanguinolenta]|nr:hypothetical protein C8R45DRAFT_415500 [Mycena sanguinolenta]